LLSEELPSYVKKLEKRLSTPAIDTRQAHLIAIQSSYRWTDTNAEADSDIAQHTRAEKHTKQLEKAIDTVLAEEEEALLVVL
jgi:hypothetical protein